MIISHSKKYIFFHIYKVAGNSIESALMKKEFISHRLSRGIKRVFKLSLPAHIRASELKDQIATDIFQNYHKFAFVRNPFDWQVSLYSYALEEKKHHQHLLRSKMKNFEEYIGWRINKEIRFRKDFVYDKDGESLVDFIGKYENLQNDFFEVCKKIGIRRVVLSHKNKSYHKPYQEYYNSKTKKLVYDAFRKDFEAFGYKMM
ncbi:sulfotransferase family protein [bacterium]|nr:sulfotransferase family protein [bacterium]